MRHRRGNTLAEVIVSMFVFVLILGLVFLLFGIGSRGFRTMETRQTAQNQLAAVRASLQRDLQVSHFYGVHLDDGGSFTVDGVSHPRHALSAVGLSDWDDPSKVDEVGVPIWDQWVVYRATNKEKAEFMRHVVLPEAGQTGRRLLRSADRLSDLVATVVTHDPSWDRVSSSQILARGVRGVKAALDGSERAVQIEVTLEQQTDPKNPKPDVITAVFYIKPHNTVPTD